MKIFEQIRAFVQFLKVEFTLVGEEKFNMSTVPATVPPGAPPRNNREAMAGAPPEIPIAGRTNAFVSPETLLQLPRLSKAKFDALEFGCIKVNDAGIILMYNKFQADFAGVDQQSAIGKNFFRELAPCTNNRLIYGRFKDGVAQGELNSIITYAFTYKMRPTLVRVHLYRDPETKTNWVLVQKHESTPGK